MNSDGIQMEDIKSITANNTKRFSNSVRFLHLTNVKITMELPTMPKTNTTNSNTTAILLVSSKRSKLTWTCCLPCFVISFEQFRLVVKLKNPWTSSSTLIVILLPLIIWYFSKCVQFLVTLMLCEGDSIFLIGKISISWSDFSPKEWETIGLYLNTKNHKLFIKENPLNND